MTLTPKEGYTITSVDCNVTAKIDTKNWTVTIPAGLENVVIDVETKADEYTLTYSDSAVWKITVTDKDGNPVNTGNKVKVGERYTFTGTEVKASDEHNGVREFRIDGNAVCDAELTVEGKDPVIKSVSVTNSDADFQLALKLAADGKLYSDSTCETQQNSTPGTTTTLYYYEDLGTKAVITGEYVVEYDADGALTLTIGQKR